MTTLMESSQWFDYRDAGHVWLPIRNLGMQRSLCGYLASQARLTEPAAPRCMLCACIARAGFATAERPGPSDSAKRVHDVRRIRDHVRRAIRGLRESSFDDAVCEEALAKLASVEADLVALFRLERVGTGRTSDDEAFR